jgi:signal transduction histidine kinase/CHASE3 domain sensor protein
MKTSIRQKLIIFAFIILAGNLFIGFAVYNTNQKRIKSEQLVQHTEDIISNLGNILLLGKDIESASRGFIITNDSTFLEPLFTAEKIIFNNIGQLRQQFKNNAAQQQRVDSIHYYMQKRLDFSLQQAELRSNQGLLAAIDYASTNQGMYYSDNLRQISATIERDEVILLKQRQQSNEYSANAFNWISRIMNILIIVVTILLLIVTGKNLLQNEKKEKKAAELIIANNELAFQNTEKENRAAELIVANKELKFQNQEKGKRAEELVIANDELAFQNNEKGKRAAELIVANEELLFQNEEKEKRAKELIIANEELVFQNNEKGKRAAELIVANEELVFQNEEKEKRAEELIDAYKELIFQNQEKEKRAAELIIADKELAFQNEEKGKRAAEFVIVNKELVFQNEENEKQEAANKELEAFSYSVSHDLRAPLRHIGGFVDLLVKNNASQLDEKGIRYLKIISESSHEMGNLIDALLTFSRLSRTELQKTKINSQNMVAQVLKSFGDEMAGRDVEINIAELPDAIGDETLIHQVWENLISNALKYSKNKEKATIAIGSEIVDNKTVFSIRDNGAGFDMKYADKLFGVFQRMHKATEFEGIGIGLANVNRIVVRHGGKCRAESEVGNGATFFFSLPNEEVFSRSIQSQKSLLRTISQL